MISPENELPAEPITNEATDDFEFTMYVPIKRAKNSLDGEISTYASMYQSAANEQDPLIFWKNAEKVRKFNFIINLF